MSEDKYQRVEYQNVHIETTDMISDNHAKLVEGDTIFTRAILSDEVYFDFPINTSDPSKVRKIEIKNICPSLMTAPGYYFRFYLNNLIKHTIQFLDSEAGSVNYVEYLPTGLKSFNFTGRLQRRSGDLPYITNPNTQITNDRAYLINPCFGFTIAYYYY